MTVKGQRFLDRVAQTGELEVTVLASSKFPDDMRERKPQKLKIYEYSYASESSAAWSEVSVPSDGDQFDAAEEAAQLLWNDGDGGTHNAFEQGETLLIREKGETEVFTFKVDVDYEPQFYVKPVTT